MGVHRETAEPAVERRRVELLSDLVDTHHPDWIALQEAPRDIARPMLQGKGYELEGSRHRLLTGWRRSRWEATPTQPIAYPRASALVLREQALAGDGRRVLVCNVHLPSRLFDELEEIEESLSDLMFEVQSFRNDSLQPVTSEIIVGDFNLEPYDQALRGRNELYGNRSLRHATDSEAERGNGLERERTRMLFNPSWQLYGATAEPLGTYYTTKGAGAPWYVFDQALFSADLIRSGVRVDVITEVGPRDLLSPRARMPDKNVGSDHLPVLWSLE